MNRSSRVLAGVLVLLLVGLPVPVMPQDAPKPFKPEEIDALVAPIALHPDSLLAQVLIASTYPLEVVQAARFVKDNPNLKDDPLNEALKKHTWDDSVKSLVFFPQVLTMMNEKLDWLQKVGDAFLAQQDDVMAAVQRLRARAHAAGNLKSTPEQNVIVQPAVATQTPAAPPPPAGTPPAPPPPTGQAPPAPSTVQVAPAPPSVIVIEPANPQVVYVPSYNPTVVYGAWPPAYPPPYYPYPAGYFAAGFFTFAAGAAVGAALWGNCNWNGNGGGDVNINNSNANNFTNNVNNKNDARNRVEHRNSGAGAGGDRSKWQHSPEHRKGVQYRDAATQQRFDRSGPGNAQSREGFRGRSGAGSDAGRTPQQGGLGQRGAGDRQGGIGQAGAAQSRQGGIGQAGGAQGRQGSAFGGVGQGRDTQSFSNRGNASRESFSRSTSGGARGGGSSAGGGSRGGGGGRSSGGGGGRGGGRR